MPTPSFPPSSLWMVELPMDSLTSLLPVDFSRTAKCLPVSSALRPPLVTMKSESASKMYSRLTRSSLEETKVALITMSSTRPRPLSISARYTQTLWIRLYGLCIPTLQVISAMLWTLIWTIFLAHFGARDVRRYSRSGSSSYVPMPNIFIGYLSSWVIAICKEKERLAQPAFLEKSKQQKKVLFWARNCFLPYYLTNDIEYHIYIWDVLGQVRDACEDHITKTVKNHESNYLKVVHKIQCFQSQNKNT